MKPQVCIKARGFISSASGAALHLVLHLGHPSDTVPSTPGPSAPGDIPYRYCWDGWAAGMTPQGQKILVRGSLTWLITAHPEHRSLLPQARKKKKDPHFRHQKAFPQCPAGIIVATKQKIHFQERTLRIPQGFTAVLRRNEPKTPTNAVESCRFLGK